MSDISPKYFVPQVVKVTLRRFSLYSNMGEIVEVINDGVFCLAGANGLGKSTFINALNYVLTGIVAESEKFESFDEFLIDNARYADEYFSGRILEEDRDFSDVTVHCRMGGSEFEICRGIFEVNSLRTFRHKKVGDNDWTNNYEHCSNSEKNSAFEKFIVERGGFESFSQYVFLQHFVLTFDERRILLFWNKKVTERLLHLIFGASPEMAKQADVFKREIEKAESRARNAKWQKTKAEEQLKEVKRRSKYDANDPNFYDIYKKYEDLESRAEVIRNNIGELEQESSDASLRLANHAASQAKLRLTYEDLFSRVFKSGRASASWKSHPIIQTSLKEKSCQLCGANHHNVLTQIEQSLQGGNCPLCHTSSIDQPLYEHDLVALEELDGKIAATSSLVAESLSIIERKSVELASRRQELEDVNIKIAQIKAENGASIESGNVPLPEQLNAIIDGYQLTIREFEEDRKRHIDLRDKFKTDFARLNAKVEETYRTAEAEFLPLFKNLATLFLGIDLAITLDSRQSSLQFLLEVDTQYRRRSDQLSESQRFFIDIALRMAVVQYIQKCGGGAATLFIDTPEGSLDIAYESRAGQMFGAFVEAGSSIIMTANINSSQLLHRLAVTCGKEKMVIQRMTAWTSMSQVQQDESELFDIAFDKIQHALDERVHG